MPSVTEPSVAAERRRRSLAETRYRPPSGRRRAPARRQLAIAMRPALPISEQRPAPGRGRADRDRDQESMPIASTIADRRSRASRSPRRRRRSASPSGCDRRARVDHRVDPETWSAGSPSPTPTTSACLDRHRVAQVVASGAGFGAHLAVSMLDRSPARDRVRALVRVGADRRPSAADDRVASKPPPARARHPQRQRAVSSAASFSIPIRRARARARAPRPSIQRHSSTRVEGESPTR